MTSGNSYQQSMSVVALGSFNPAIFHPEWFARNELIRENEAKTSEIKVISPEVTVLSTEWFTLQVTGERFSLESKDERKFLPLRDLVVSTFDLLEHTPIKAFGLNRSEHFKLESETAWHELGHHFAPKTSWENILDHPGMSNLTMEGTRSNSTAERIQITIKPSTDFGVVISINEHYQHSNDDESQTTVAFVSKVRDSWSEFTSFAKEAAKELLRAPAR
jgi:hypothetical protein